MPERSMEETAAKRPTRNTEPPPQAHVRAPSPVWDARGARVPPAPGAPSAVLSIQRAAGNLAVMRMLDAQRPGHPLAGPLTAVQRLSEDELEDDDIQRAAAALHEPSDEAIRSAAVEGVRTPATTLPHLDRIQASFGRHSIAHVQAHVGLEATRASRAMNALAYASGDHVVFGATPDLRTAAHEAAHIVQQQSGVQLSGGIGRAGDRYERHADAVADAVVAGRSAEDLLKPYTPDSIRAKTNFLDDSRNPEEQKRRIQRDSRFQNVHGLGIYLQKMKTTNKPRSVEVSWYDHTDNKFTFLFKISSPTDDAKTKVEAALQPEKAFLIQRQKAFVEFVKKHDPEVKVFAKGNQNPKKSLVIIEYDGQQSDGQQVEHHISAFIKTLRPQGTGLNNFGKADVKTEDVKDKKPVEEEDPNLMLTTPYWQGQQPNTDEKPDITVPGLERKLQAIIQDAPSILQRLAEHAMKSSKGLKLYRAMERKEEADIILEWQKSLKSKTENWLGNKGNLTAAKVDTAFHNEEEAGAIGALPVTGHLGDKEQAGHYIRVDKAENPLNTVLEFTLKRGAHKELFTPNIIALGTSGTPDLIGKALQPKYMTKFQRAKAGEGKLQGYIGLKPEQHGPFSFAIGMAKPTQLLFQLFVDSIKQLPDTEVKQMWLRAKASKP